MSTAINTLYLKLGIYGNPDYGKRVYWLTDATGKTLQPYEYIWCNELDSFKLANPDVDVVILPDVD